MNNEWIICRACEAPHRERDMLGEVCVEYRTKPADKKSVPLSSLTAVLFRQGKEKRKIQKIITGVQNLA